MLTIRINGGIASIALYPAMNNGQQPYGSTTVSQILVENRWVQSSFEDEDWALLFLNSDIGNQTGWANIKAYDDYTSLIRQNVTVIGYPKEHLKCMYIATGQITRATSMSLFYDVDTSSGQSGAPVYNSQGYVIGIHNAYDQTYNANCCANITIDRYNTFRSYMN